MEMETAFRHILVPLDGTPMAEVVLPAVAELARICGARVTLLHVIEHGAPATIHGFHHLGGADEAEIYLNKIAREHFPPDAAVSWHVHTEEVRKIATGLAEHVSELGPDLIVMCSYGGHGLRDMLSGNLAQQVLSERVAPVLLFKAASPEQLHFPFQNILVPLDGNPGHESGLVLARTMALVCKAALKLVLVIPTAGDLRGTAAGIGGLLPEATRAMLDMAEGESAEYLGRHMRDMIAAGVRCGACVTRGDPAEKIMETAHDFAADLLVLGAHGKAGTTAFWAGSIAQKIIRHLPSVFLLVPAGSARSGAQR